MTDSLLTIRQDVLNYFVSLGLYYDDVKQNIYSDNIYFYTEKKYKGCIDLVCITLGKGVVLFFDDVYTVDGKIIISDNITHEFNVNDIFNNKKLIEKFITNLRLKIKKEFINQKIKNMNQDFI
mgnify:CR=1 FL=1